MQEEVMNMKDAAQIAVRDHNAALAWKLTDYFRDSLGWSWEETYQVVKAWTGASRATWDGLLREADEGLD